MKKTLITTTLTAAALTLTACSSGAGASDDTENFSLSGEDYSHLLIMARWVPEEVSQDPVEGSASVRVKNPETDEDIDYYTPAPYGLEIPTIDADDWYTEYILVDDGMTLTAGVETKEDSETGELQCGIVSLENGDFLDFQQSAGDTSVTCHVLLDG